MKIQKGALSDASQERPTPQPQPQPIPGRSPQVPGTPGPVALQKDRLFETLDKEEKSNRNYAKLFLIAVVVILIAGGVIFYLTLPKPGDLVRAPKGAEDAVRAHLLEKQKRDSEDIVFYYCGDKSYWARADVKTRSDVPNPLFKIGKYAATVKGDETNWEVASKPIVTPVDDQPCN